MLKKRNTYTEEDAMAEEYPTRKVLDSYAYYCEKEEEYNACES